MENSINNKRIDFLDFAKGIAMFLVVLGHTEGGMPNKPMIYFIHGFFMPLFYVVFGYLMALKKEYILDIRVYLKKRFYGLIVPCVYMYIILYSIYIVIQRPSNMHELLYPLYALCQRNIMWNAPLWFLFVLFDASLIFYLQMKIINSKPYRAVFMGIINILLTLFMAKNIYFMALNGIGGSFIAAMYIFIGYLFESRKILVNKKQLNLMRIRNRLLLVLLFFLGFTIYTYLAVNNPNVNYSINDYGDKGIGVSLLTGVLGSYLFLELSILLSGKKYLKFLNSVGNNSLFILGFHLIVNIIIVNILGFFKITCVNFMSALIICTINITICTFVSIILKSYRNGDKTHA